MQVIFVKTVKDKMVDAILEAEKNDKSIDCIVLTRDEFREFAKETGITDPFRTMTGFSKHYIFTTQCGKYSYNLFMGVPIVVED